MPVFKLAAQWDELRRAQRVRAQVPRHGGHALARVQPRARRCGLGGGGRWVGLRCTPDMHP
eukprot:6205673-Pleurochrysis_carterae.AAC.3